MQMDLFEYADKQKFAMLSSEEANAKLWELVHAHEKLRKGIFQRYQDLRKVVLDLQIKLDEMTNHKSSQQATA